MALCGEFVGGLLLVFLLGRLLSSFPSGSYGRRARRLFGTVLAASIASVVSSAVTGTARLIPGYLFGAVVMAIIDGVRGDERPPNDRQAAQQNQQQVADEPVRPNEQRQTCPCCTALNDADAKFCERCGKRMGPAPCPKCDTPNRSEATYCKACGASIR